MNQLSAALLTASLISTAGCGSPAPSKLNFSVHTLPPVSRTAALDAAEDALREHGFRIARRDPTIAVIESQPLEAAERQPAKSLMAVVGSQVRLRRIAEVRVNEQESQTGIFCRVRVQEYVSDQRRLFVRERNVGDVPDETPADREAATTGRQNATWRTRERDKGLERQLLDAIIERLGTPVE